MVNCNDNVADSDSKRDKHTHSDERGRSAVAKRTIPCTNTRVRPILKYHTKYQFLRNLEDMYE